MVEYFKAIVDGYKTNKYKDQDFNLDLTYVTERVIGMSFPGSGLETIYRNNISDVAKLLEKKHGRNYMVINLSEQAYDYKKFNNQVQEFPWEDHHSPPIHLLFQACKAVHDFLSRDPNNVVVIHCLAGKGRTGTVIACYLLYTGRFTSCEQVLQYYKRKRFAVAGGVGQPSQIRYIEYFEKVLKTKGGTIKFDPIVARLESITMNGVPNFIGGGFKPIIKICSPRNKKPLFTTEQLSHKSYKFNPQMHKLVEIFFTPEEAPILTGDILVKVYHKSPILKRDVSAFRFAFNMSFLSVNTDGTAKLKFEFNQLDPSSLKEDTRFPPDFSVELGFKVTYRKCDLENNDFTSYTKYNNIYQEDNKYWELINHILEGYKTPDAQDSVKYLFIDPSKDDVEQVLSQKESVLEKKTKKPQDKRGASESMVVGISAMTTRTERTMSVDYDGKSY